MNLGRSTPFETASYAQLNWSRFNIGEDGEPISGSVQITFRTERRFPEERKNPEAVTESSIFLEISGSTHSWVNQVFDDVHPALSEMAHGGILRPLWYFGHPYIVHLSALAGGWVAMIWESTIVNRWMSEGPRLKITALRDEIIQAKTAEIKFDMLIKWWLTPENSPMTQEIGKFMAGLVTFFVAFMALRFFLPLLTPNSSIAIGIGHKRAVTYLDGFKIIVFGVLVSAILVPLIMSFF